MKTLGVVMLSFLLIVSAAADVNFNDGGNHLISYVINDNITVDWGSPGIGTTLTLVDGGSIGPSESGSCTLRACEDSIVNVEGGYIEYFLTADGRSRVTMSGGHVDQSVASMAEAQLTISGGSMKYGVYAYDDSRIYISGGDMSYFYAGRNFGYHYSLITLDGYSFQVNSQSIGYGAMASDYAVPGSDFSGNPCLTGTITGTLVNGNILNNQFYIFDEADITFVPEPATLLLLGLGSLALLRKRRK